MASQNKENSTIRSMAPSSVHGTGWLHSTGTKHSILVCGRKERCMEEGLFIKDLDSQNTNSKMPMVSSHLSCLSLLILPDRNIDKSMESLQCESGATNSCVSQEQISPNPNPGPCQDQLGQWLSTPHYILLRTTTSCMKGIDIKVHSIQAWSTHSVTDLESLGFESQTGQQCQQTFIYRKSKLGKADFLNAYLYSLKNHFNWSEKHLPIRTFSSGSPQPI